MSRHACPPAAPVLGEATTPDSRRLSTFTWGDGSDDLVVLEAGLGFSGRYWGPVARELSARARTIAYDRAGLGVSTSDQQPRTLDRLAADLCTVIESQPGERVVLVGHSWGGPIVRRTASLLVGRQVVGLVLVDPTDEGAAVYRSRAFALTEAIQTVLLPPLAGAGLLRWLLSLMARRTLPEPDRTATLSASATVSAARASVAESKCLQAGLDTLREQCTPLNIPCTVISGAKRAWADVGRKELIEAHRRRATTFPQGRFVEAHGSQHMIPLTEPRLIAEEVARLLEPAPIGP